MAASVCVSEIENLAGVDHPFQVCVDGDSLRVQRTILDAAIPLRGGRNWKRNRLHRLVEDNPVVKSDGVGL